MSAILAVIDPRDAETLARLHAQCFETPWDAAAMRDLLNAGAFGFFAGPAADAPHGFVLSRVAADEGEILSIGVVPVSQSRGLGRALLTACLAAAWLRGAQTMFLEVATDNAPARALYEKLGFRETGRRKGYYARAAGPAADALVMRLANPQIQGGP